jgi:hypothetical protein
MLRGRSTRGPRAGRMRGRGALQPLQHVDPGQDSLKPQEGENQLINEDAIYYYLFSFTSVRSR